MPAAIVASLYGASGTSKLLVRSQVILSLQLSFAVFPLVMFTSDRAKMGEFVNPWWVKGLAHTGFAARHANQLKLRESEEMRLDMEYLERLAADLYGSVASEVRRLSTIPVLLVRGGPGAKA